MPVRIAVLGATGVAGRTFVDFARNAGHAVVHPRVDLFDANSLNAMLVGCDAAVNLVTSIPSPRGTGDWATNDRIRREGTRCFLDACANADVPVAVQQSVAMLHCTDDLREQTEDDPIEGYGVLTSAIDMEALCRTSAHDVRVVRGGLFYGPDTGREETWCNEVKDPAFRTPGDGLAWLSPVHVADFASALLAVLARGEPRGVYIACDDIPLRTSELYALAAHKAGAPEPSSGGPERLRSFRVTNAKLRSLDWTPAHAALLR